MKIIIFRGDLTDISARKEALLVALTAGVTSMNSLLVKLSDFVFKIM